VVYHGENGGLSHTLSAVELPEFHPVAPACDYMLYGLRIRSPIAFTVAEVPPEGAADVEFLPGDPDWFADLTSHIALDRGGWIHHHELADGWSFIRYDGMFEFLVAPAGDRIFFHLLAVAPLESFQSYALGRTFSFALVKMGYEPLHAATVVVDGRAFAFLGASAFGKSSMAASFLAAGYALLTDDVLRLEKRDGRFWAFPGPPRLKLFPEVAHRFLPGCGGLRMNPRAEKLVYPLLPRQSFGAPAPLAAVFVLGMQSEDSGQPDFAIRPLSPRESLLKVLSFTHNDLLMDPCRLEQQFLAAQHLVNTVPIREVVYPRALSFLPHVRDTILTYAATIGENPC